MQGGRVARGMRCMGWHGDADGTELQQYRDDCERDHTPERR
jgi:hypothetical protein